MAVLYLGFPVKVCSPLEYFYLWFCEETHCTGLSSDVLFCERIQCCVYEYNVADLHQSLTSGGQEASSNL